ncbi:hypothetical protein PGTUg99_034880 [Puccinia graminis f. sp. tritici]|uniref:Uncharacterized protein n=1 Tax=Puccinia graminis f. sp. tritici TaxID=56615 RepID=A0A5B0RVQ1_PUCGR|nr:hypothetical protein PGTUg99_034880 [Puccinia graminis f. sp. tritici]
MSRPPNQVHSDPRPTPFVSNTNATPLNDPAASGLNAISNPPVHYLSADTTPPHIKITISQHAHTRQFHQHPPPYCST